MVFQHFNLFPNMTVLKNITLAPVRLGKWNAAEADQKARALFEKESVLKKKPMSIPESFQADRSRGLPLPEPLQ